MYRYCALIPVPFTKLLELGRIHPQNPHEPFCMTVLALKLSRAANAVSELHGCISRHMWHCLYPEKPVEQVPIGHITNGIHLLGWMKGTVRRFWRGKLIGEWSAASVPGQPNMSLDWDAGVNSTEFWQRLADPDFVSDEELWALRYKLRRELIEFARRRLLIQGQRQAQADFIAFDNLLNPDALTIGFARRFATNARS
jgi:starch phosphorylase